MKELKEAIEKLLEEYANEQGFMVTEITVEWVSSTYVKRIRVIGESR